MTPQKHKNGSSGAALLPPRHQTHADSLPEHTSAAASTFTGKLQYPHFRFKSQQTKGIPFRPPRATRGCLSACSMFLLGKDALNSGP